MQPTAQQTKIRDNTQYITGSTHYHKRAGDGMYEIVASLYHHAREALSLSIGVQANRQDALASVRFFRGHKQGERK